MVIFCEAAGDCFLIQGVPDGDLRHQRRTRNTRYIFQFIHHSRVCDESRALRESVSHVVHITDIPSRQEDVAGEYPKELENSYYERGLKADSEGAAACGAELFSCMQGR